MTKKLAVVGGKRLSGKIGSFDAKYFSEAIGYLGCLEDMGAISALKYGKYFHSKGKVLLPGNEEGALETSTFSGVFGEDSQLLDFVNSKKMVYEPTQIGNGNTCFVVRANVDEDVEGLTDFEKKFPNLDTLLYGVGGLE